MIDNFVAILHSVCIRIHTTFSSFDNDRESNTCLCLLCNYFTY